MPEDTPEDTHRKLVHVSQQLKRWRLDGNGDRIMFYAREREELLEKLYPSKVT